eukprot:12089399-Heterocapsa_arctica.AAC.1
MARAASRGKGMSLHPRKLYTIWGVGEPGVLLVPLFVNLVFARNQRLRGTRRTARGDPDLYFDNGEMFLEARPYGEGTERFPWVRGKRWEG